MQTPQERNQTMNHTRSSESAPYTCPSDAPERHYSLSWNRNNSPPGEKEKASLRFLSWNISKCLWRGEGEGFTHATLGLLQAERVSGSLWRDTASLVCKDICYSNMPCAQKTRTLQELEKTDRNCVAPVHHRGSVVKLMKPTGKMMFLLNFTCIFRRI